MVFDDTFYTVDHNSKGTVTGSWENLVKDHSDITTQENFTLEKEWHINKSSNMLLPREACQEDSMEPGPQDLPLGSYPQAKPSGMTEEPTSTWGTEASTNTTIPYTGEGELEVGNRNQVSHSNIAQNPTNINLDAANLSNQAEKNTTCVQSPPS